MIKEISVIRKELDGYEEIEYPFKLERGCSVKYITLTKNDDESFYLGGEFQSMGNDCVILKNNNKTWSVPICKRNKDGSIKYNSRFFIKEKLSTKKCDKTIEELNEIIEYQQSIINKMSERLKTIEIKLVTSETNQREYEEMLQQNRYNYKDKCIELRDKNKKIMEYEEIIQKLTNSHSIFQ